jgi:oxygen-independent coproporphyrinogen-3 oxidase
MSISGVYVHLPFCRHKCAYCDFNSYAGGEALFAPYLAALQGEARAAARLCGASAPQTLYVGGGTPTVLPAADLAALIEELRQVFKLAAGAEITVEANPGTVDVEALRALRRAGVGRLSLGVQSFDEAMLRTLERIHDAEGARQAVRDARAAGFVHSGRAPGALNLDLILGLPGQTLAAWQADLRQALALAPEHLSLYALTIEPGTPLAARIRAGALPAPDDDRAADMFEWAEEVLARAGYVHYEISNWARPGCECRHNLIYWRNEPYLGLGAGAHSWWAGRRWSNLRRPADYIRAVESGQPPVAEGETIDRALEMGETMMMGLRLLQEGVSAARFARRFGRSLEEVYRAEIGRLCARGLLERRPPDGPLQRIRLTRRGHLLGNQVFAEFLPD